MSCKKKIKKNIEIERMSTGLKLWSTWDFSSKDKYCSTVQRIRSKSPYKWLIDDSLEAMSAVYQIPNSEPMFVVKIEINLQWPKPTTW